MGMASDSASLPRQIPYIVGSEVCERFSYYGMRSILTTFLITSLLLHLPDGDRAGAAKDVFHSFVIGVYFFPLLGGWLSDRFFGKFYTVFWMSLVYSLGHACLAFFDHNRLGFYTGLGLIAIGAGGIKPLVSSFVGDQFSQSNKHLAKIVFDAFYWIINFGSFFASLLMPIFLRQFGAHVAFGIPGVLMFAATILFWFGRNKYVMLPPEPSNPHAFGEVLKSALLTRGSARLRPGLWLATGAGISALLVFTLLPQLGFVIVICLALLICFVGVGSGSWLQMDRALVMHPEQAVESTRNVLRLLVIFLLTTPFYALFDQQGSTWVIQGSAMSMPSWFHPAQMQALNPLLVLLLIPLNNILLYPWLRRRGWKLSPLHRMTMGIILGGLAWIVVGHLQMLMDSGVKLSIAWQILPYILGTMGEVLVSATGLEFVYSQAPSSMKGVVMSFWNLVSTIGNLWVLLIDRIIHQDVMGQMIAATGLSLPAFQIFLFALLALLAALLFGLYGCHYRMQDYYQS